MLSYCESAKALIHNGKFHLIKQNVHKQQVTGEHIQEWLQYIYIAGYNYWLIMCLTVLLEYLDLLQYSHISGRAQQAFGRAWATPDMSLAKSLFETNVSHVLHFSAILVSDYSCFMFVYAQTIILELFLPTWDLLFLKLCRHNIIRCKPTKELLMKQVRL